MGGFDWKDTVEPPRNEGQKLSTQLLRFLEPRHKNSNIDKILSSLLCSCCILGLVFHYCRLTVEVYFSPSSQLKLKKKKIPGKDWLLLVQAWIASTLERARNAMLPLSPIPHTSSHCGQKCRFLPHNDNSSHVNKWRTSTSSEETKSFSQRKWEMRKQNIKVHLNIFLYFLMLHNAITYARD